MVAWRTVSSLNLTNDHWSSKQDLSIDACICLILNKERAGLVLIHNHSILVGSHGYPTKYSIYKSIPKYNDIRISNTYNIINIYEHDAVLHFSRYIIISNHCSFHGTLTQKVSIPNRGTWSNFYVRTWQPIP